MSFFCPEKYENWQPSQLDDSFLERSDTARGTRENDAPSRTQSDEAMIGTSDPAGNFASRFERGTTSGSDCQSRSAACTGQYYKQLQELKRLLGIRDRLSEARYNPLGDYANYQSNGKLYQQCERVSCSIRLQEALIEVESRKFIARKLRESLDRSEVSLLRLKNSENELEEELRGAKTQLKRAENETRHAKNGIESEREERVRMQKHLESQLQCQMGRMSELREQLESTEAGAKQRENSDLVLMKRAVKELQEQLLVERRCKVEACQQQEEYQREVDALVSENEDIKRRFRQNKQCIQQLEEKYDDLMADYSSRMANEDSKAMEIRLIEDKEKMECRLREERLEFAKEVERCQTKCRDYQGKVKHSAMEAEKLKLQLRDTEASFAKEKERYIRDRNLFQAELKKNESTFKTIKESNKDLLNALASKDKEIERFRRLESEESKAKVNDDEMRKLLKQKTDQVEYLHRRIKEIQDQIFCEERNKCASDESKVQAVEKKQPTKENSMKKLEEELAKAKVEIKKMQDMTSSLHENLQQERKKKGDIERKNLELEALAEGLKDSNGKLQTMLRDVEGNRNQAASDIEEIHGAEVKALNSKILELKEEIKVQSKQIEENKSLKDLIKKSEKERENGLKILDSLKKKLSSIQNDMAGKKQKLENEIESVKKDLEQEKEKGKALAEQLKNELSCYSVAKKELETAKEELENAKKKVATLTENTRTLMQKAKEIEDCCIGLKKELQTKKDEHINQRQIMKEKEREFKEALEAEEALRREFERKAEEAEECYKMQVKGREKVEEEQGNEYRVKFDALEMNAIKLQKENEKLKGEIAQKTEKLAAQANAMHNAKELSLQLDMLRQNLEKEKARKAKDLQDSHAKRRTEEENLHEALTKEIDSLKLDVESKQSLIVKYESQIDTLKREVEYRKEKMSSMSSTLECTKTDVIKVSEKAMEIETELKRKVAATRDSLKQARSKIAEMEEEKLVLEQKVERVKDELQTVKERNNEMQTNNMSEYSKEKERLKEEVRKLQNSTQDMYVKAENFAKERNKMKEEKRCAEKSCMELEKTLQQKHNELESAYQRIGTLEAEKRELSSRCKTLDAGTKSSQKSPERHPRKHEINDSESQEARCKQDFEEGSGSAGKSEANNNICAEEEHDSEVKFDEDDDDFWNALIDDVSKTEKRGFQDTRSKIGPGKDSSIAKRSVNSCESNDTTAARSSPVAGAHKMDRDNTNPKAAVKRTEKKFEKEQGTSGIDSFYSDENQERCKERNFAKGMTPAKSFTEDIGDTPSVFLEKQSNKGSNRQLTAQQKKMMDELGLDEEQIDLDDSDTDIEDSEEDESSIFTELSDAHNQESADEGGRSNSFLSSEKQMKRKSDVANSNKTGLCTSFKE